MKLSELKGEAALDTLSEIIEPAAEIFADSEIMNAFRSGKSRTKAVKLMLKNHKRAVIEIMAALDGIPVDDYQIGLLTLPAKLLEMLNDPELKRLFTSAEQTGGANPSGSASGNAGE